ncbi:MAG: SMR family transporter, partial [Adlercreutzia sp.]|nr:SMR family transporter [Adlercreutzia sp.]
MIWPPPPISWPIWCSAIWAPTFSPSRSSPARTPPWSSTSRLVVNWLVLVASGVMESVWAIALGKSEGFSHAVPTVVFAVALVLSMLGL